MRKCITLTALFGLVVLAHAAIPDGFAVYSKGDASNRTLYKVTLSPGATATQIAATETKICNKGSAGGDIQSQISFDGKWLAFARSRGGNPDAYGGDDYHKFDGWDVYIVSLEGSFPATPKLISRGYWPSWSDDSYNATKTLYYTTAYSVKTIRAVTVDAQGNTSNDRKLVDINTSGDFQDFTMCAPNGQYYAGRYAGIMKTYHFAGTLAGQFKTLQNGCHPSITADSRWVIQAQFSVGRDDGSKNIRPIPGLVNEGWDNRNSEGSYSFGSSPCMGWFVTWTYGNWRDQNLGMPTSLYSLTTSSTNFSVQKQVQITATGSWPDVHAGQTVQEVEIKQFNASPDAITAGGSSTISWEVSNATSVKLNGSTVTATGSQVVTPASTTTYTLEASKDGQTVSRQVTVTVTAPTVVSIDLNPASCVIVSGATQAFTATAIDQFGDPYTQSVSYSWSATGGTLSATSGATVNFTAGSSAGSYKVTASSGSVSKQAEVLVYAADAQYLRINSGGPSVTAGGVVWESGDAYVQNGENFDFGQDATNLSSLSNPAPAAVYRTVRHWDHQYSFGALADGEYIVRIHFVDHSPGLRKMVYKIEGETVLSDFDLGTAAAAQIKEFSVTVQDGNGLQIAAEQGGGNDVFESGIEIIRMDAAALEPLKFTEDYAGKTYAEGQDIAVKWTASPGVVGGGVGIHISVDDGLSWMNLSSATYSESHESWGNVVLPLFINGESLVTNTAMLKIFDYNDPTMNDISGKFTIIEGTNVTASAQSKELNSFRIATLDGKVLVTAPGAVHVSVVSLNGRIKTSMAPDGAGVFYTRDQIQNGVYMVEVTTKEGTVYRKQACIVR